MSYQSDQKLIDIMFEVGLMIHQYSETMGSREDVAKWIAAQLKLCGYDTQPMGASWGSLKK